MSLPGPEAGAGIFDNPGWNHLWRFLTIFNRCGFLQVTFWVLWWSISKQYIWYVLAIVMLFMYWPYAVMIPHMLPIVKEKNDLRTDATDVAFMFNGWQSPASILVRFQLIHPNRQNHDLYSKPSFPEPQLHLLSHTLRMSWGVIAIF